jgi:hypothetical protein
MPYGLNILVLDLEYINPYHCPAFLPVLLFIRSKIIPFGVLVSRKTPVGPHHIVEEKDKRE